MYDEKEEAQLAHWIAASARGDRAAFAEFYDATKAKVYGLVRFILRDEANAEEAALDTYLQAWREACNYRPERGSPLAWLVMMARSRAIDRLRSQAQDGMLVYDEPLERIMADGAEAPDRQLEQHQRRTRVQAGLQCLPVVERQLLTLAFFIGLSHSEIAEHSRLPLGTVKTHIRQGLGRLKVLLADAGERSDAETE